MTIAYKKHLTPIFLTLPALAWLSLAAAFLSCSTASQPTEEEDPGYPKDGVITFKFFELATDSSTPDLDLTKTFIDSLNISEVENRLDISNAIPFRLPYIDGVSIWFFGDFHGMPDTVGVWSEYTSVLPNGQKWRFVDMDLIPKNQGFSQLGLIGAPKSGPVRGFVFALDHDNRNSGLGIVTITLEGHTDTLRVDAARNTVCYTEQAARVDFALKDSLSRVDISSRDRQSYRVLKDQCIWLLEYYVHGERLMCTGARGLQSNPFNTNKFTAYGFAPHFISP